MNEPEQITMRDARVCEIIRAGNARHDEARDRSAWRDIISQGEGRAPYETPARPDSYAGKKFWEIFPDGAWSGHRCFIVGGGPSLKDFNFSILRGENVIAVNMAFLKVNAQIMFSMDSRLYQWIVRGILGAGVKTSFDEFAGIKTWLDTYSFPYQGVSVIPSAGERGLSKSLQGGLCHGQNSGYAALNMAVCLGASPIYLLGFDMGYGVGGDSQWHGLYPTTQPDKVVRSYADEFERQAEAIHDLGIQVININPASRLRCFEFGAIDEVPKISRPLIVSYFTPGTIYEVEAKRLVKSCRRFNLENEVLPIPDHGGWQDNTLVKARFILEALDRHRASGRGVLFVDADAEIKSQPWEIEGIAEHVGLCWRDYSKFPSASRSSGRELLSGTIYFSQADESRELLYRWIIENDAHPNVWEQRNMERLVTEGGADVSIKEFPPTYAQIFDSMKSAGAPVIEHFQASRTVRAQMAGRS